MKRIQSSDDEPEQKGINRNVDKILNKLNNNLQQDEAQSTSNVIKVPAEKKVINDSVIYLDDPKDVCKHRFFATRKGIAAKRYVTHNCSPACILTKLPDLNAYNPLTKPLLSCWERQIAKASESEVGFVHYKAPCGRRIRKMSEIKHYLTITGCDFLEVDNFDFNEDIQVMLSYDVPDQSLCPLFIKDISEGKEGREVSVVNAFENETLHEFEYSVTYVPMKGVDINKDPEFLICCDCTDDCADKMKCSCFQLTIKNALLGKEIGDQEVDYISYEWKRLLYLVETGIYECNSRCKCSKRCLNRVAQNPIQVKMQIFRTATRGWGVQSCHDIPAGSFICVYAGCLYTEQNAEALEGEGECFAQLDLIENVIAMKEGFEENVDQGDDDETEAKKFRKLCSKNGNRNIYVIYGKRQGNVGRFFNVSWIIS
jgi:[histone H3]-N6,N6-dimethyl-lysine9 N-methyltransferase